jgi:hypothetical protein
MSGSGMAKTFKNRDESREDRNSVQADTSNHKELYYHKGGLTRGRARERSEPELIHIDPFEKIGL